MSISNTPISHGARYFQIACECIAAGILTAWVLTCAVVAGFDLRALLLPGVFVIATASGVVGGLLLSPFVFLLRRIRFACRAAVYVAVIFLTSFLAWRLHGFGIVISAAALATYCLGAAFWEKYSRA
jgi:hypothetical protein